MRDQAQRQVRVSDGATERTPRGALDVVVRPVPVLNGAGKRVDAVLPDRMTVDLLIEIDGADRPACVAQALFRHYHVKAPD